MWLPTNCFMRTFQAKEFHKQHFQYLVMRTIVLQSEKKLYWGLLAMNIRLFPSPWCSFFFNRFNSSFDQCNSIEVSSPPPILDMIVKCICWGSNNDFDDSAARARLELDTWAIYLHDIFILPEPFSWQVIGIYFPQAWVHFHCPIAGFFQL